MTIGDRLRTGKPWLVGSKPCSFDRKLSLKTGAKAECRSVELQNNERWLNIRRIADDARALCLPICRRLLPAGRIEGHDWVALNPVREDRNLGSFRVHIDRGYWIDFATGDRGGDLVALVAYLDAVPQGEAARRLADMLPKSASQ